MNPFPGTLGSKWVEVDPAVLLSVDRSREFDRTIGWLRTPGCRSYSRFVSSIQDSRCRILNTLILHLDEERARGS